MKHTPGPYLVHRWGENYQIVQAKAETKEKPGIAMTGQRILAKEISKANAPLFAAAPDLLLACIIATGFLAAIDTKASRKVADICREAIDKAEEKVTS